MAAKAIQKVHHETKIRPSNVSSLDSEICLMRQFLLFYNLKQKEEFSTVSWLIRNKMKTKKNVFFNFICFEGYNVFIKSRARNVKIFASTRYSEHRMIATFSGARMLQLRGDPGCCSYEKVSDVAIIRCSLQFQLATRNRIDERQVSHRNHRELEYKTTRKTGN